MSKARRIGNNNQQRSRSYMLREYLEYGITDGKYIQTAPNMSFSRDFFATEYIDKNGEKCLAGFDLIGTSLLHECMFVIQVKTNWRVDWEYLTTLQTIKLPSFFKRQIHIWYTNKHRPKVINI